MKSRTMREYMIFVDKARRYSEGQPLDEAIERTVEECIQENVLRDFLLENKAEVKKMCLYEYDEEQQRKWDREEGREDGREEERNRMVKMLLRQGILSDEKIMEVAEISEEELNRIRQSPNSK